MEPPNSVRLLLPGSAQPNGASFEGPRASSTSTRPWDLVMWLPV